MGKDEQTSTKIRGNPGALKDSEEARQTERSRDGVREASEGEPRGERGCRGEGAGVSRGGSLGGEGESGKTCTLFKKPS